MKTTVPFICASILTVCTFSTANATVLINEIDYDQISTDTAEFIELFNAGTEDINLKNYRLDLFNGTSTSVQIYNTFDLSSYSLAANSYFVICGNASMVANCDFDTGHSSNMIQNGASDGIALYHGDTLIDAMTYEGTITGITEGSAGTLADQNSGIMSIGRLLNSQDTNNNAADFERGCITPGRTNIAGSGDCSIAASGTVPLPSIAWLFAIGLAGMVTNSQKKNKGL